MTAYKQMTFIKQQKYLKPYNCPQIINIKWNTWNYKTKQIIWIK